MTRSFPRNVAPNQLDDGAMEWATPADARAQVQELYKAHSTALVRQLTRQTGCVELAREFAQESFARLLRLAPGRLGSIEKPEAYLRRMSSNLVRDWGRANATAGRAQAAIELGANHYLDQVMVLECRDTLRLLEQVVSRMKPRTREIFLAHRVDGQSYAEIAARFGLTVKGVEKQMSKAIAKIDRALDRG